MHIWITYLKNKNLILHLMILSHQFPDNHNKKIKNSELELY